VEVYIHSPNTPSWRGAQLKYGDNFTFYLYLIEEERLQMCGNERGLDLLGPEGDEWRK